MNWEAVHVVIDGVALLASIFAFFFSWGARKNSAAEELRARVITLEAQAEHQLTGADLNGMRSEMGQLSQNIARLDGELKIAIRTLETVNTYLMQRGGA